MSSHSHSLGRGALALLLLVTSPAAALVHSDPDDHVVRSRPDPDPGWNSIGRREDGLGSAVYLGNSCALTAGHVGAGPVQLGDATYQPITSSGERLTNSSGSPSDLLVFGLNDPPKLPTLTIAETRPRAGALGVLIGYGRGRGEILHWKPDRGPGTSGWHWAEDFVKRWGTNVVDLSVENVRRGETSTRAIVASFSRPDSALGSPKESQAAQGDSGGALFVETEEGFDLAGLLFSVGVSQGQPPETAMYGNRSYAADLSYYHDQIVSAMERGCGSGTRLIAPNPLAMPRGDR